jgi:DNA polymerase-2
VPQASELIVAKRFGYKRLIRETESEELREIYRARDGASKWCGVAIFGFAAHTSAKFGLTSAHSAVCAYAREFILRAKEQAERRGFRVLHIITDCLFLSKENSTDAELEALGKEIEHVSGLPVVLEDRFKWTAFLHSRVDPRRSVPNMYFAAGSGGGTKIRGIAARRHDTPAWIEQTQRELVERLAEASTLAEIAARLPELMQIVTRELDRLRAGHVPLHMLTIACSISKLPGEYKVNSLNAAVARQLEAHGVELHPGERIRYIVLDHEAELDTDRVVPWSLIGEGQDGYDVAHYEELFLRACEQVFTPLGITAQMLRDGVAKMLPLPVIQKQLAAKTAPYYGPLFAAVG